MAADSAVSFTMPVEMTERIIYLMGEVGFMQPQIGGVIRFRGRVDAAVMRRAVGALADSEPVLRCDFCADEVPPVWRLTDPGEILQESEAPEPDDAADRFIAVPLDPGSGPQLATALFHGPQSDSLALKLTHIAADGGALKEALYALAECYRSLELDPSWKPEVNHSGVRHPLTKASVLDRIRAMSPGAALLPPSDWGIPDAGRRGSRRYFRSRVEPAVFRAAADRAREYGATVNDLVLTAYYRTLFRVLAPESGDRTPVQMSNDLRRHLPEGTRTALANMSGLWTVTLPALDDESFDATLARVATRTSAWKRSGAGRSTAIGVGIAERLMRNKGLDVMRKQIARTRPSGKPGSGYPTFTNIGVIDEDRLFFGDGARVDDAYLLGPIGYPTGLILTASTYGEALHLSCGFDADAMPEQTAVDVVDGTVHEIGAFAAPATERSA